MNILIAADMEGITGVVNWDQVTAGHFEYPRFRALMTEDVNAAIQGAFEGGASKVTVADGHASGTNILIEQLDPRAVINCSNSAPHSMIQGISPDITGMIYIGYHARHGTANAICDHTYSSRCVSNLWINGILTGEYGLNAAIAGYFGVPVIMVSGDQMACAETIELLGKMPAAIVKVATGRHSAECLPPAQSHPLIKTAAKMAVQNLARGNSPKPFLPPSPVEILVELKSSDMADRAARIPGTERDGLRIRMVLPNMQQAYFGFRSILGMASNS